MIPRKTMTPERGVLAERAALLRVACLTLIAVEHPFRGERQAPRADIGLTAEVLIRDVLAAAADRRLLAEGVSRCVLGPGQPRAWR